MKVLNIEKTQGANGILWDVTLAKKDGLPSKVHLVEREEPDYGVDDDVPVVMIKPPDGSPWYYKRTAGSTQGSSQASRGSQGKSMKADPLKTESIERQCALKVAEKLYCHSSEAGTPFDDELFDGIYMHSLKLLDPLIAEAIKEGAKLKT